MANILITTTPLVSNIEIKRYICPIIANVVLGVNFFSDFAASITDVFGGNSETYQEKLDLLTYQVGKIIKDKATLLGANAVIDYKLSFNEISGKGKQMFMVTATGTACLIVMPKEEIEEKIGQVTYTQLKKQYLTTSYSQILQSQGKLSNKNWANIFSLNLTELADSLTKEYLRLKSMKTSDFSVVQYKETFEANYKEYLSHLNKDLATKVIYSYIQEYPNTVVALAVRYSLFSPQVVIELLNNGKVHNAIKLINGHKDTYTSEDLKLMKEIVARLDALPDKGHCESVKSGMFSKKEEEMYLCPNGHKNSKESIFCTDVNCGLNIKGLNSEEVRIIQVFKGTVEALEVVLNNSESES